MATHIKIMIIRNGKAMIIEVFLIATSPPLKSSTMAINDNIAPQMIFILLSGFKSPCRENIPITKVAESAEVTKKVIIRIVATKEAIFPKGKWASVANNPTVTSLVTVATISIPSNISKYRAVPPKTVNHKQQKIAGRMTTPSINSLTVRPLDILAIKVPTKGPQDSHQAQ